MADVAIAAESPRQDAVVALVTALDRYLLDLYPADTCHLLDIAELEAPDVRFFVARKDGVPVGCAALRVDATGYGEVKRMYVDPAARGHRIGDRLLARLEEQARAEGLSALLLESGIHQHEALALYRKAGFANRGPYACYEDNGVSVFMEKLLTETVR
ncbi:putative acetyltransferase [Azospirillum lipoferum]|uniref:GNAT family N-acetyltransferase n=1 Tax=Azospirillum lipoferum TaxID=193 RepID=A0A5A9GYW4_AZOLI|nr:MULTISPECIES: GNAT family N-acetyltransferase [Azospirillum]KAA0598719.1 GNAT family N-acetyltransferase [Azospirillum lipoferum]MCP1609255.1 putative acetyltransferase [Azospirillum lipoferum]MDW5535435.1 GNAT family N-acetyltransferase [Azospirillum sp. NL1]